MKKTGCSDRWGRLAKAPPRLQRCSSAKRRGCTSELTYSRSSWPVRSQGRSGSRNDTSAWGSGPPQQTWRKPNETSARQNWKGCGSRKQKLQPEYRSRSIRRNEASCELASDVHRASTGIEGEGEMTEREPEPTRHPAPSRPTPPPPSRPTEPSRQPEPSRQ